MLSPDLNGLPQHGGSCLNTGPHYPILAKWGQAEVKQLAHKKIMGE